MYDTLLALHLLSAVVAFVTIVMFSAFVLGAPASRVQLRIADVAWNISGPGLMIFGIWLAIEVDGYELWDGWILGAFLIFLAAGALGMRAKEAADARADGAGAGQLARYHWLRTAAVLIVLILMVWKPGA